jgi:hypothetical protein
MSFPIELEFEVQPPPPIPQTDSHLSPPRNFGKRPTAMGGGDFDRYEFTGNIRDLVANTLVDHEDLVVEPWKIERLNFSDREDIVDTITQSPIIRISDKLIKDEI